MIILTTHLFIALISASYFNNSLSLFHSNIIFQKFVYSFSNFYIFECLYFSNSQFYEYLSYSNSNIFKNPFLIWILCTCTLLFIYFFFNGLSCRTIKKHIMRLYTCTLIYAQTLTIGHKLFKEE